MEACDELDQLGSCEGMTSRVLDIRLMDKILHYPL